MSLDNAVRNMSRVIRAALRALNPAVMRLLVSDILLGTRATPESLSEHLSETMGWLCRAQDQDPTPGISAGFSLIDGWLPPYPETTGYTIPTFFDYAQHVGETGFRQRAIAMAEWEIHVQMENGAVQSGFFTGIHVPRAPAVFNTGQVIIGWCRAYDETADRQFLSAAIRAGDWLLEVQDRNGAWSLRDPETSTTTHAYDSRTSWALLMLSAMTDRNQYVEAAERQLAWVLGRQLPNGWFENNAFFGRGHAWGTPFTHTISYVIEGLLGAWDIVGRSEYLEAAQRTMDSILPILNQSDLLPGQFDGSWNPSCIFTCLTGNAQLAAVCFRLSSILSNPRYIEAGIKLNRMVMSTQSLGSSHPGIRGGVKGSHPIYGRYTRFTFVNWAAKFLVDSLILEDAVNSDLRFP